MSMLKQTWETRDRRKAVHARVYPTRKLGQSLGHHKFSITACVIKGLQVRGPFLKSSGITLSNTSQTEFPKGAHFLHAHVNVQLHTQAPHLQSTKLRSFFLAEGEGKQSLKGISDPWGLRRFVTWAPRWSWIWKRSLHWSKRASLHTRAPLWGCVQSPALAQQPHSSHSCSIFIHYFRCAN